MSEVIKIMKEGISILIPVYNEEKIIVKNVKKLVNFLDKLKVPYEVLICDNGSTDKTPILGKILSSNFPKKVRFLSVREKRSVGCAFKKMVYEASYDNLISLDADLSINYRYFIPNCFKLLEDNAMVIGSKKIGNQERKFYRKFMSDVFIFLVRILLGLKYSDFSIGAKGYRKSVIKHFLDEIDKKTFYVIKIAYYVQENKLRIAEIPVKVHDVRRSRFNIIYDALYRGINLLKFWFLVKIIRKTKKIPNKVKAFPNWSTKVSP